MTKAGDRRFHEGGRSERDHSRADGHPVGEEAARRAPTVTGPIPSVRRVSLAAALMAAALVFASACGGDGGGAAPATETPQPFPPDSPLTLVDGGQGGLTLRVTWVTPDLLASPEMERAGSLDLSQSLAFYVSLDTEAPDLSTYDLSRITVLRDLDGGEYQPEAWFPWSYSTYHREGLLLFRKVELGSEGVELVIRGLGGVTERSYRWSEPPDG